MKTKDLKTRYEDVCNEYVKAFCKKQDIEFDFWIGEEVGGLASFATSYYFNFNDIVYDVNAECPKGLMLQWQNEMVEAGAEKMINYYSYSKGARVQL